MPEKEHSPYDLVFTDGMLNRQLSAEDRSCLEGVHILSRSESG